MVDYFPGSDPLCMNQTDYRHRLEEKKADNTLQLLFKAARLTNDWAIARTREARDVPSLRTSHTTLFPHIDLEGTRITTLAERVGISKQAVSELVDELEGLGVVTRRADPTDGRAKLVVFTEKGKEDIFAGLALLKCLEEELAQELGERQLLTLRRTLTKLISTVEEKTDPSTSAP